MLNSCFFFFLKCTVIVLFSTDTVDVHIKKTTTLKYFMRTAHIVYHTNKTNYFVRQFKNFSVCDN